MRGAVFWAGAEVVVVVVGSVLIGGCTGGVRGSLLHVGRFEAVQGDSLLTAINVDSEVFCGTMHYWIRAIVWWLQGFTNTINANENMGAEE